MATKTKWGYKSTAMVLRPWIVQLLISGDLKQRAQKVQVLQSVRGRPRLDGSIVKEITDGQTYIKAAFTREAYQLYHESVGIDESQPPSINDALLILNDYRVEFVMSRSEYQIVVERFTVWTYQEGFNRKISPTNSMDHPDVKKKIGLLCSQFKKKSSAGAFMDMSLSSLPLTQLLEEIGEQSLDMEAENSQRHKEADRDGREGRQPPVTLQSGPSDRWPQLPCVFGVEDFIIPLEEQSILEAITEWRSDYEPSPTPSSGRKTSGESPSKSDSPKHTMRKKTYTFSKHRLECSKKPAVAESPKRDEVDGQGKDLVDAEIQVSQSLWNNFLDNHKTNHKHNLGKEVSVQAHSQEIRSATPGKTPGTEQRSETPAQVDIPTESVFPTRREKNNNRDSDIEILNIEKQTPEALSALCVSDEQSQSLLNSKPEMLKNIEVAQDLLLIGDSFSDGEMSKDFKSNDDVTASNRSKNCETKGSTITTTTDGKTIKDINDNDSPVLIEIHSSEEMDVTNERSPVKEASVDKIKPPLSFHLRDRVTVEDVEEERRLANMKHCKTSFVLESSLSDCLPSKPKVSPCNVPRRRSLRLNKSLPDRRRNEVGEGHASEPESPRLQEEVDNTWSNKRRLSASDSEVGVIKKVCTKSRDAVCTKGSTSDNSRIQRNSFDRNSTDGCIENKCAILSSSGRADNVVIDSNDIEPGSAASRTKEISLSLVRVDEANKVTSVEKGFESALLLSGQSAMSTASELQDAQVVSSGEPNQSGSLPMCRQTRLTAGVQVSSEDARRTPINSLPSYQPQRPSATHSPRSLAHLRQTFWGVLDPEPVSDIAKSLLNMTLPTELMERVEFTLSGRSK